MALPITARAGAFVISLGNNADPIVYTAPCGFTSKAFRWSRGLTDVTIPDCDDPDAPNWVARDVSTLSASVNGEGVLAAAAVSRWVGILNSVNPVPVEIEITFTTGTLRVLGLMQLENFEVGAQNGQRVSVNVSMQSDGAMTTTWTAIP